MQKRLPDGGAGKKISLEILYNRLEPFFKAQLAYGLALVLLLLALLTGSKRIPRLGVLLLLAGLLAHSCGLLARMIIMNRPPVTNLYETFVFVAWTAVLLGFVLECWQKNLLGVMSGGIAGLLFLLVAGRYSLEGDTMGMLAAVLDSNLWLTTHVVTISMGYAGCVIAGIIGHVYIIHQLLHPGSDVLPAARGQGSFMPSWLSAWFLRSSAPSWAGSGPTSPGGGSGDGIPRKTAPC